MWDVQIFAKLSNYEVPQYVGVYIEYFEKGEIKKFKHNT